MISPYPFKLLVNPKHGIPGIVVLPQGGFRRAKEAIQAWEGYVPTPLHDLPAPGLLRLKDEGPRFGLGSFKALGGAYAVEKLVKAQRASEHFQPDWECSNPLFASRFTRLTGTASVSSQARSAPGRTNITVTCATDGNHGRSVAWGARRFGCRCVIFIHEGVSEGRAAAIAAYGAQVVRTRGNYDDSVREAERRAQAEGWFVVSDTSYPGYTEVPRDVMQGYRLMADEAADQWTGPPPTHVFIQAGVGGVAAAVSVQMRARFDPTPRLVVIEPENAACLYASAQAGAPSVVGGELDTVMAGLACGEPSLLAWQELERTAYAFMTIPDAAAAACLRWLASLGFAVGESGVAGVAAYLLATSDATARSTLGLDGSSRVLAFATEGVTDAEVYEHLLKLQEI